MRSPAAGTAERSELSRCYANLFEELEKNVFGERGEMAARSAA